MGMPTISRSRIGSVATLCLLAVLTAGSSAASAQDVETGLWAASGNGPTPTVAFGIDVRVGIPWVAAVGELSRWDAWGVDCSRLFPESLRCEAGGTAYLGGLQVVPPHPWPIRPYVEGKLGQFGPSPVSRDERRTAASAEVGVRFDLSALFSLEIGARRVWIDDDPYEEAIGEAVRYSMLDLRFLVKLR